MKKTLYFGKIDAENIGEEVNLVEITLELEDNSKGYVFSAYGAVWDEIKIDHIMAGQIIENLYLNYFNDNETIKRIHEIHSEYHLNDLNAGTQKQEEALSNYDCNSYEERVEKLKELDLYIDEGYRYGSSWLFKEIPDDIIEEIKELMS